MTPRRRSTLVDLMTHYRVMLVYIAVVVTLGLILQLAQVRR
jgi:uncharacterized membrane protein YjgN (DUF898 family)